MPANLHLAAVPEPEVAALALNKRNVHEIFVINPVRPVNVALRGVQLSVWRNEQSIGDVTAKKYKLNYIGNSGGNDAKGKIKKCSVE